MHTEADMHTEMEMDLAQAAAGANASASGDAEGGAAGTGTGTGTGKPGMGAVTGKRLDPSDTLAVFFWLCRHSADELALVTGELADLICYVVLAALQDTNR